MFATIFSVLIAAYFYLSTVHQELNLSSTTAGNLLLILGSLFFFLPPFFRAFAWSPLQSAEKNSSPYVVELYSKDRMLLLDQFIFILFAWLCYGIVIDLWFAKLLNIQLAMTVWIVVFGVALDALYRFSKRTLKYLNPKYCVELFTKAATKSIQDEKEKDLYHWIDALAEVATRAIQSTSTSLCNFVCNELQKLMRLFLDSAKSISHHTADPQSRAMGISDKVSYTLFYVLQRLEVINNKAAQQHLEPVCSNLVTIAGKIVLASAQLDISLATYPLPFLGRFALTALQHNVKEVGPKAVLTLQQVAKGIINDNDVTYMELQEPFFALINQMNEITKEMFRQDKNINVQLLMQPFLDLKELFKSDKVAQHADTPAITQRIDAVLSEYSALETVLKTMPAIP